MKREIKNKNCNCIASILSDESAAEVDIDMKELPPNGLGPMTVDVNASSSSSSTSIDETLFAKHLDLLPSELFGIILFLGPYQDCSKFGRSFSLRMKYGTVLCTKKADVELVVQEFGPLIASWNRYQVKLMLPSLQKRQFLVEDYIGDDQRQHIPW